MKSFSLAVVLWLVIVPNCGQGQSTASAQGTPAAAQSVDPDYLVFVVCEGADKVMLLRFSRDKLAVERETKVGLMPMDINGPHGIAISPDKKYVYISIGHGRPQGFAWKLDAQTLQPLKSVTLGLFPATADVTPDGTFLFVANANFHGDMVPSSVSAIATDQMIEVRRITTCTMPHGSRLNPQGSKHYSACMMDDLLVEIETESFSVSRYFVLTKGKEQGFSGAPPAHSTHQAAQCTPTWAQPSNDGSVIYVACNQSNEIVAVDTKTWTLLRRFPAGNGVYNLAMAGDGRLVATNKRGQSVSVFDPVAGKELARIPTKRKVVHAVIVTPDDHYAFISVEGIGSEPGTVEVIDLRALKTLTTLDVGEQAAGLAFWKSAD